MKKKFLFVIISTMLLVSISIYSFAMGNIANNVRNFVGGTENVVTDVKGGIQNTGNTVVGTTNDNNNNGYTATRTSGETKIAGMTTNAWSWLIMGITAAAIIILVWSYIKQRNRNDIYIDSDEL